MSQWGDRTAATEPKQQALEYILARAPGTDRVVIVSRQWWLVWPIAYLATAHPNVGVSMGLESERRGDFDEPLRRGRFFFVEFADTPELAGAIEWIRARGLRAASSSVRDAGGRDLLQVLQVMP